MALLDYPPLQPRNFPRTLRTHVPLKAGRDALNRLRFGANAPRTDEPIFPDPAQITHRATGRPQFRRRHSGLVTSGDWDLSTVPIDPSAKMTACRRHFLDGLTWEETGILDLGLREIATHGQFDGARTLTQLRARYAGLDRLYDQVQREGRMRLRAELPSYFRREFGGLFVHITRTGDVIQAGGGIHRLAIAQIIGLAEMPAQLGVIHPDALATGHLARLRHSRHNP